MTKECITFVFVSRAAASLQSSAEGPVCWDAHFISDGPLTLYLFHMPMITEESHQVSTAPLDRDVTSLFSKALRPTSSPSLLLSNNNSQQLRHRRLPRALGVAVRPPEATPAALAGSGPGGDSLSVARTFINTPYLVQINKVFFFWSTNGKNPNALSPNMSCRWRREGHERIIHPPTGVQRRSKWSK